jgi:hypothetical protein
MKFNEAEEVFAGQLKDAGIVFVREYQFIPGRKFRADFAFNKIIVEINGGTWMQKSGHSTAKGIQRDYEKSNAAQLAGFIYLQFIPDEVYNMIAIDTVKKLLESK